MDMKRKTLLGGALALALAIGGVGVANAVGGDDDTQATGPAADKATAAALALIPGGTANAVERDGEDGATWEVEVAKPDGSTVDVRLDASYGKVVIEEDSE
jgi:hypothetical protein